MTNEAAVLKQIPTFGIFPGENDLSSSVPVSDHTVWSGVMIYDYVRDYTSLSHYPSQVLRFMVMYDVSPLSERLYP